jgi:hypothetical protein
MAESALGREPGVHLRVFHLDQTRANQHCELREIASRMGCAIVKVLQGSRHQRRQGRDKRPAFDKGAVTLRAQSTSQ